MAPTIDSNQSEPIVSEKDVTKNDVQVASDELTGPPIEGIKADAVGRAFLEETRIVPLTSQDRKTTTKWELIWYYLYFCGK